MLILNFCFSNLTTVSANKISQVNVQRTKVCSWKKSQNINESNTYFMYTNASKWKSVEDFYCVLGHRFMSPFPKALSISDLKSMMKDLRWFPFSKKVVIFVYDLSKYKEKHKEAEEILELFEKDILPFWEGKDEKNSVITEDAKLLKCLRRQPQEIDFYYT